MINKTYRITKHHDIIVKKVAKKLKMSEAEVIRKRIKPFSEMLKELKEDMENAQYIDLSKL